MIHSKKIINHKIKVGISINNIQDRGLKIQKDQDLIIGMIKIKKILKVFIIGKKNMMKVIIVLKKIILIIMIKIIVKEEKMVLKTKMMVAIIILYQKKITET